MFKNVASQKITMYAYDATTGLAKTGDAANLTAYVGKDTGTITALTDTSATERDSTNAKGGYTFDVSQSETNANYLEFFCKSSTANIVVVPQFIYTTPPNFSTLSIDSSGYITNVLSALLSTAGQQALIETMFTFNATADYASAAAGSLVKEVADNAGGSSFGAADFGIVDSGTAQSATGTTLVLRAAAAFANSELVGGTVLITGGTTGVGQSRSIIGNVGSTDTITVDTWTTTPTGTITYKVFGTPPASATSYPLVQLAPVTHTSAIVPTVSSVTAVATGGITAASLAADTLTAAKIAADVTTELQAGLATAAALATVSGYIDTEVAAIKAKTDNLPADPADASDIAAAFAAIFTTAVTEAYRANGAAPTLAQFMCEVTNRLAEQSISSTTRIIKGFDHSTTKMTDTLNSSTTPTSVTRAT